MQTLRTEKITLYFHQGSSDKIYQAAIDPADVGFAVNFAYGRRGSTLQTGTKTPEPVDHAAAQKIFNKLIAEKMAKGYSPGEEGAPYQQTDKGERSTGILPQLLNPISEEELSRLLADDNWWGQEKFDGKRVLIRKDEQTITGINRRGLTISLPESIVTAVQGLDARHCLLDGEAIGEQFVAFDLLHEARLDLTVQPYHTRYVHLVDLMETARSDSIRYAEIAIGKQQKESLLDSLRRQNKEGIVFKQKNAPYVPGRPASGGMQLKLKFCATASCIVTGSNGSKRSVKLHLIDGSRHLAIGSVTIPANHAIPAAGQIVEVRYLYAYPGGSLFQPVYLGLRDDLLPSACNVSQLKFKAAECEEA